MIASIRGWTAGLFAALALAGGATPGQAQGQASPEEIHQRANNANDNSNVNGARALWDAACIKDYVPSCMALGQSYNASASFGSTDGARRAIAAFRKACDLGHGEGCLKLGDAQTPLGMLAPPKAAQDWAGAEDAYRKACDEFRIGNACYRASELLGSNRNPQTNFQASKDYLARACGLGHDKACEKAVTMRMQVQTAEAGEEHTRKYGKVDGLAPAEPGLLRLLRERQAANRSTVLKEDDIAAIRAFLLADGLIDDQERDFLIELTHPVIRAVRVYRAGAADPWQAEAATLPTLSSTRRDALLSLLDQPPPDLTWDESDRKGTLMRLARTSRTPGMEGPVKALIAGKVAELAALSSKESKYQPLSTLIVDMSLTARKLESECQLPRLQTDAVRTLFSEAAERGITQSAQPLPRALHTILKPVPGTTPIDPAELPKVCTE